VTVHVFHGPSATPAEVAAVLPDARRYPPVRHGDLLTLDPRPGDTVLLLDGVFHATAPVRHKEILRLLADGVTVAGAASMGALRAAELHPYGMVGLGRVFAMYRDGVIDGDDEVAVAHTPDDLRPLSVALVDVRGALDDGVACGALRRADADRLLALARAIPYPLRGGAALRRAAEAAADLPAAVRAWWAGPDGPTTGSGGLKHADALAALAAVARGLPAPDTGAWVDTAWETPQARLWTSRYRARGGAGGPVPVAAELQHQQLYDPGFPARWRAHVLAWIAGDAAPAGPPEPADRTARTGAGPAVPVPAPAADAGPDPAAAPRSVADRAIAVARGRGLSLEALPPARAAYWLTPADLALDDARERLLRLLVRSARLPSTGHPRFTGAAAAHLLDPGIDSAAAVLTAWRVNAVVAASAPHRSVHRLRPDLLAAHLAEVWRVPADDPGALDAAARDRGFFDAGGAVEAARGFYLYFSGRVDAPA
jgi:hypothetical protein